MIPHQCPDGYVAVLREEGAQGKTIPCCIGWVLRFFVGFSDRHRRNMGCVEIKAFLSKIATFLSIGKKFLRHRFTIP